MAKELDREAKKHEDTQMNLKNTQAQMQILVTLAKRMFKEVADRVRSLRTTCGVEDTHK